MPKGCKETNFRGTAHQDVTYDAKLVLVRKGWNNNSEETTDQDVADDTKLVFVIRGRTSVKKQLTGTLHVIHSLFLSKGE